MQHWQKDRMKLVITLILAILALGLGHGGVGILILLLLIAYWGYRWSKGNIDFKNPNKNNP